MQSPPPVIKNIPLPPSQPSPSAAAAAAADGWTFYGWIKLLLLLGAGIMMLPLLIEMIFVFVVSWLTSYRG
ncbi:hypothetical protein L873DRAFT_1510939 [Choiromyces venosus 120613-1]|uniref:Uncharacterized protein n=1 Tax=Choiromyces venosus 120613-1 TaxID=1336337 RepID=A0A3N4J6E5_9PEZI|nr:hypothetical protein L873DRAFT_1510939 [Choiromyces venosus 120613-1]